MSETYHERLRRNCIWCYLLEHYPVLQVPIASLLLCSNTKSAEECVALKPKCIEAAAGEVSFASTNNAVAAQLVSSLLIGAVYGLLHVPMAMLIDFPLVLGCEIVFGNIFTLVEILVTCCMGHRTQISCKLLQ